MTKEENKRALAKAVKHLYEAQVIGNDGDIATATKYKKSAISLYIKGSGMPSDKFIRKFEEVFKLKLEDFHEECEEPLEQNVYTHEYIALLKSINKDIEAQNAYLRKRVTVLEETVLKSLKHLVDNNITSLSFEKAAHEKVLAKMAGSPEEAKKLRDDVYNEAAEIERGLREKDKQYVVGTNDN